MGNVVAKDTPIWTAVLSEEGEPLWVWSKHLSLAGAVEKCKVKCGEMIDQSIGLWTAFVITPTGERVWVAGAPLRDRLVVTRV